jgi:hypothetical protein
MKTATKKTEKNPDRVSEEPLTALLKTAMLVLHFVPEAPVNHR